MSKTDPRLYLSDSRIPREKQVPVVLKRGLLMNYYNSIYQVSQFVEQLLVWSLAVDEFLPGDQLK